MAAGLLSAALVETALISYRDVSQTHVLPLPGDLAAVALIYGGLGFLPDSASGFAAAVGWGFVVATFLNLWGPTSPTSIGKQATTSTTQGATTQ